MNPQTNTEKSRADKKLRAAQKNAAAIVALNNLPSDLGRNRVLDAEASAIYWGVSLPHWRRLYRAGKVPRPIKIGDRKLGWRIGSLADNLAKRADAAS
jgi:predicted DNA-binding transcriptional regulator AlpA